MTKKKLVSLTYLILTLAGAFLLISLSLKTSNVLSSNPLSMQDVQLEYNSLQKQTSLVSIIVFIVLLLIGFINYYTNSNSKYIVLANLLYIPVTLFNYVSLNYSFHKMQGIEPNDSTGFWLLLFIGIFYIIGAIVISVIGYLTIRNLVKRAKPHRNNNSI